MAGDIGKLHPKEDFWKQVNFLFFPFSFPFIFLSIVWFGLVCFWFVLVVFWLCFGVFFWRGGNFCLGFFVSFFFFS